VRGYGLLAAAFGAALLGHAAVQGQARNPDPTGFASASQVRAQVESMRRAMKPGQGFLWRPLVRGGNAVAALEYWTAPGKPAVHPGEAEYVVVVAGAGNRIEGGTIRSLHTGDVFLIPAGTPHWFGIRGGRLVLLGTKLPQAQP
jgi:quercetin dioxygenase-like cupin family protein